MSMRRSPSREALRKQFAEHAERACKKNHWSYAEIAARLGITKQAYAKYLEHEPGVSSCPGMSVLRKAREVIGFKEFEYMGHWMPTVMASEEPRPSRTAVQLSLPLFGEAETPPNQSTIRIPLGRAGHVNYLLELKLTDGSSRNAARNRGSTG